VNTMNMTHSNQPRSRRYSRNNKHASSSCKKAALMIAASCVDTTHAFTECFPHSSKSTCLPQHRYPSATFTSPHTYNFERKILQTNNSPLSSTSLFYAPNQHTSQTAPMVAQAFYKSHTTNRNPTKPKSHNGQTSTMPLSSSVLSSSDTLPSFTTAHGLLSPETVMRMEVMTSKGNRDNAVDLFLETYRNEGPMACLPMLSDEKVLPRLTEALRDIIA